MYLILNSQTCAFIRLKIIYEYLSGAFLFLLGIYLETILRKKEGIDFWYYDSEL